ncbi:MAG: hypothetical protein J5747_10120 [Spirochaetaceae bacterium]|nr:hypothetical protein [Spirochaetaceae bacterium]
MSFELAAEIQKRYGNVRRARGCYLYTEKGVRLTDCYLDGGRALLGWDGGKARTVFKDTLERGATGAYCGGYESRLATAVRHLLPREYTEIRWYYGDCASGSANSATCAVSGGSVLCGSADGASAGTALGARGSTTGTHEACVRDAVLWRPWLDICAESTPKPTRYPEITIIHPGAERPAIIRLVPPYPWATTLCIYAFRTDAPQTVASGAKTEQGATAATGANAAQLASTPQTTNIPPSDVVPAPLLAAYARAFCDLKTALGTFGENDFKCFAKQLSPLFDRRACWLFPKIPRDSYEDFAKRCLDAGIVVSPDYDTPSLIPWRANKGDIKRIAECF